MTLCSVLPDIREPLWLLQTRENPQENVEPGKRAAFKGQPVFLVQEVCSVRNTNRKDRKAQVNPHHCVELSLRMNRGQCGLNTFELVGLSWSGITQNRGKCLTYKHKDKKKKNNIPTNETVLHSSVQITSSSPILIRKMTRTFNSLY